MKRSPAIQHQLGNLSLIGVVAAVILEVGSLPASAAVLADWHFDPIASQLEITLQDETTPHYFLLAQPPRIVLDLPNTQMGRVIAQQNYSGAVRQVRVSQFQPGTTRIVLELSPLVDLTSEQVQLQRAESVAGETPSSEWRLRLASQNTAQDSFPLPTQDQSPALPSTSAQNPLPTPHSPLPTPSLPSSLPPATFDTQQVPTISVPPLDQTTISTTPQAIIPSSPTPLPALPSSQIDNVVSTPTLRPSRRVSSRTDATAAAMLRTTPRSTNLFSQVNKQLIIEFGQPLPEAPQQATAVKPSTSQPAAPAATATPLSSLPKLQPAAPVLPLDPSSTSTVGTPSVVAPPLNSVPSRESLGSDAASDRSIDISTSHSMPTAEPTSSQSSDTLLPAGTQFSVRYAGEFSLTLKAGLPLKQVLVLQDDLRDRTGNLIAPADTPVIGHFETNGRGSRFIAQAIALSPQNLPLAAQSDLLAASGSATLLPGQIVQIRLTTSLHSNL